MSIHIKAVKSYYVTEVSLETPVNAEEVSEQLRSMKTNGKMVVVYSGGGIQGHSFEQKTPIPEAVDDHIRKLLHLGSKELSAASRKKA